MKKKQLMWVALLVTAALRWVDMNPDIQVLPGIFQGTDGRQFKPGAPGLTVVGAFEAASVYGGSSSSPSKPTPSQPSNPSNVIQLKNIQYIPQQYRVGTSYNGLIRHGTIMLMNSQEVEHWEDYKNNVIYADYTPDETKLCGVASALMVRSKSAKNTVITPDNVTVTNNCLTELAYGLYMARYGGYSIDVNNYGLLYWDGRTDYQAATEQFDITHNVLVDLYTAQKQSQWLDYISLDRGYVTSISIYCMPLDSALNLIWTNIENNREPSIAIANSSVIDSIRNSTTYSSADVTLHYIVIAGIRKNNGVREFYVLDPWHTMKDHWYSESQMKKIIEVDFNYPYWLWNYPSDPAKPSTPNPCYVGLIN